MNTRSPSPKQQQPQQSQGGNNPGVYADAQEWYIYTVEYYSAMKIKKFLDMLPQE